MVGISRPARAMRSARRNGCEGRWLVHVAVALTQPTNGAPPFVNGTVELPSYGDGTDERYEPWRRGQTAGRLSCLDRYLDRFGDFDFDFDCRFEVDVDFDLAFGFASGDGSATRRIAGASLSSCSAGRW